jgi:hypothetical protein
MYFCIRDDDTSYFTSPDELEKVYGEVTHWGPVSLAVVPFHKAGTSKGVPRQFRGQWTVHPLHENKALVDYLRRRVKEKKFEIMLHGYHHDEPDGVPEFSTNSNFSEKIRHGRKYLEELIDTSVRVFVPPHNTIGPMGLTAIANAGLHLGGIGGFRSGWRILSSRSWYVWLRLRAREIGGQLGIPWILDLGDHREIAGHGITPSSSLKKSKMILDSTLNYGGVFCIATHYWELAVPSLHRGDPAVGDHLRLLIDCARSDPRVIWRSVGDVVSDAALVD